MLRRARVPLDELQVRFELRPAREVEPSRDDELSVGELETGKHRGARTRRGEPGMELVDDVGSAGIAGPDRTLKRLGAVLQLLEVGIAGKTAGWH